MSNGDIENENFVDTAGSDSGDDSDTSRSDGNDSREDTTYNTINSLDALKEIITQNANGPDNLWFKHYFLRHVNRLPSRHQYTVRRLSQCREEDEGNEHDNKSPQESDTPSQESSHNSSESRMCPPTNESSGGGGGNAKKPLSLVELFRNPKSISTTDIISPPRSRATSPRIDRYFFDSSLVEMKSQASSTSTIEYDSGEELWVRRTSDNVSCNGSKSELASHSQGLPTIVTEDVDNSNSGSQHRQRSGTWGQSRSGRTTPPIIKSNFKDKRKCGEDSGSNSESQSPKKGSASVFDAIRPRSKSDASSKPAKKSGNIITHVKNAVQNSLMSSGSKTNHSSGKQKHEENHVWNGTVSRPRADSDSSNNNKGAVTKVIELFRHRSQSAVSAEDKRKARAAAIHQQQIAAQNDASMIYDADSEVASVSSSSLLVV
ncbi:hypothetical protein M8J76_011806 [Diaphorina citri]|nr:hypothetical protein M8J76_011806 [Diaphorina citri]